MVLSLCAIYNNVVYMVTFNHAKMHVNLWGIQTKWSIGSDAGDRLITETNRIVIKLTHSYIYIYIYICMHKMRNAHDMVLFCSFTYTCWISSSDSPVSPDQPINLSCLNRLCLENSWQIAPISAGKYKTNIDLVSDKWGFNIGQPKASLYVVILF